MSFETPPFVNTNTTPGPAPGGLGNGLFASAALHTGERVLNIQSPFVAVLDTQRLDDTCSGCFGKKQLGSEAALKACTGCQVVKYCDKTCQAKDWKFAHSLECSIFQKLLPRILPNNARALMRIVLRSGRNKYSKQELDLFLQLETHAMDIRDQNASQWQRIGLTAKAVKTYSETDMREEAICAFGAKLDLNSFNLTNALYDRVGLYMHPYAALMNHSCDYNAVVGFDGDECFVKAIRPIQKDEQIFISYVDTTNPYTLRQSELRERYFFDCRCSKCEKGPEPASQDTPQDQDPSALQATQEEAYSLLHSASKPDTDPQDAIKTLDSAMRLLHSSSWPITKQPSISLRDELIASLLATGNFASAFIHAAVRYILIDPVAYPHVSHPLRSLHAWALAKLAIQLSSPGADTSGGAVPLEPLQLNYSLIIWSILSGLVNGQAESCTVPGYKAMIKGAFVDVHQEFVRGGVDPRGLGDEIKEEWGKLERLVSEVLEKEY